MNQIFSIARKDLILLWRDKMGLIWVFFFPLCLSFFFGAVFGGDEERVGALSIALVDLDKSPESRKYIERLKAKKILKVKATKEAEAKKAIRQGSLVAYLKIKKGFGESGGIWSGKELPLEVGIDPARRAEKGYLEGILMQSLFEGIQAQFSDPATMRKFTKQALKDVDQDKKMGFAQKAIFKGFFASLDLFSSTLNAKGAGKMGSWKMGKLKVVSIRQDRLRPASAFEISFPSGILWGLLACALGFALSLVKERISGTFLRLKMAPISRAHILAGKGLACFLASFVLMVLLLGIGALFFGVRITQPAHLLVALLSNAICFVGFMMFVSVIGKTEEAVSGAGWALMMVMAMTGGGMIPLIAMPSWLASISHFSPVKWGILALEGAIWRGFSWPEMLVPCGVLIGVGLAFFLIGLSVFSRTDTA